MTHSHFELLLFTTDVETVREAVRAGVDGIIVDWECLGKRARQAGADTQVNADTLDDLRRVRRTTDARVVCRVNAVGTETAREVRAAITAGADELLVPMVRSVQALERVLELAGDRCAVGALVETADAVREAPAIAALPLSRIYVGLNDLAIDRGTPSIFTALGDGTVADVARACRGPFGFAGLTLPDRGQPIPCRLLIAEMTRLGSDFTFLRRSYRRDVRPGAQGDAVRRIRSALAEARTRSEAAITRDHDQLLAAIERWPYGHRAG